MIKTKRIALILVSCMLVIAAIVGVSFAVWSNLEKEHVFTLKAGTLELNISSYDVLNSDQPISFDNPVTMSFKVKVEGEKSTLRFSVNSFQYSLVEGQYLPLSPDLFNIELPKTMYGVGGKEEPDTVTCLIKLSLTDVYDYDSFDPVLMGKKFRFNIRVEAETYTDPVMYDIIYNNVDGATHDNIAQWSVETNHIFKDAAKFGYIFDGWYTDELLTAESRITELTQDDPNINTLNVYAKWIPISYTITYDFGSGKQPEGIPENYTIEDYIDFNSYTPLNDDPTLLFGGYYSDAEFETPISEITVGTTGNINVFVKWVQQYNITYIDRLSAENTNPSVFSALDQEIILSDLTANGYVFDGWYIGEDKVTTIDTLTENDIELTARWSAIPYAINWNTNGGALIDGTPGSYDIESSAIDPSAFAPTKEGYMFSGWFTDESLETSATTIVTGSTGEKSFFAKWTVISYSITWNANDGILATETQNSYNIESDKIDPSAFIPAREGYTFNGWYADIDFNEQATPIVTGSTGDKTFYAKWIANQYNITWDYSGGVEITDIITKYTYDKTEDIAEYVPVRNGYTFDGWYINETKINEIAVGTIGDITIVAKWNVINYSITWNTNGGAILDAAPESYTIESNEIDPSAFTPTREGYSFGGWYADIDLNEQATPIVTGSTGDKTFYAKWIINEYSIAWELNGGVDNGTLPTKYDVNTAEIILADLQISKTGYNLVGWYGDATFTEPAITTIAGGTIGNVELFAKWEIVTYSISYLSDYGDTTTLPQSYTVESQIDFTSYTLTSNDSNYKFAGFYTDESYSQPITAINAGQTGDIKIYVKWLEIYTITWTLGDGATMVATPPTGYTVEDNIDLSAYQPTKDGFTFLGWHDGTDIVNSIPNGSTGNISLTAQWEEIIVPVE